MSGASAGSPDVLAEIMRRVAEVADDAQLIEAASIELLERLQVTERRLPPRTRSRTDKFPRRRSIPVIGRDAYPVELCVVMALARTYGAAQFGCSPDNTVFTADTDGYSLPSGRRDVVAGLSPLLDFAAATFNEWKRDGTGGRFYLRDGQFFDADDGAVFFEVTETWEATDFTGEIHRPKRRPVPDPARVRRPRQVRRPAPSLWQRVARIFR